MMGREAAPRQGGKTMLAEAHSTSDRSARALLEREGELAALERLIIDARDARGRLLLIEGPAGIGKTRLLEAARERACELGVSVLAARGGELERDFGFGIARQLLEPALASAEAVEREQLLSGAAHLAGPVFTLHRRIEDGDEGDPTHAVLHGLYWLVANLSERSPLVLAIDDVHWADRPSLRFLLHLVRRLDGVRAAIAIAARTGEKADYPELLSALKLEAVPPIVRPNPLSETAVASVVRTSLGDDAGLMLFAACHETTGGNPFLLTELIEELRREPRRASEISPAAVRDLASDRIAAALLLRVGRLDPQAPALARAVAVLGAQASLREAAALAGLDHAETRRLAEALTDAGVLDEGAPLRFVHPLVRASVYEDIPPAERAALHGRAADLLAEDDADPEAIALHLLSTDPAGEAQIVVTLRMAARVAISRGAPEVATSYLRRALDEPPSESVRPGLLLELGSAAARAGEPHGFNLMREAFGLAREPRTTAATGLELGRALMFNTKTMDESVHVLERALEAADDAELATRIEALLLICGITTASARRRVAERLREVRHRVDALPPERARMLLAPIAADLAISDGTASQAAALAKRALAGGSLARYHVESDLPVLYSAVWTLVHTGDADDARIALSEAIASTQACGSPLALALASAFDAFARFRTGDLSAGMAAARTTIELASAPSWGIPTVATLAAALIERGDLEGARAELAQLDGTYDPEVLPSQIMRESRARLCIADGHPAAALDELLAIARWEEAWKPATGIVPVAWRSAAALAQMALGDMEAARALAEDEVALARRFGAARPIGVALRALGLIEDTERGLALLDEAVVVLERAEDRLEHARALVDLGAALRRASRSTEARTRLAQGMDVAHSCGATALVERAHGELVAAGARPRRLVTTGLEALTPSERRVAEMAANGTTNKEIAQRLFVTLRTVEMHLTNAYRKLQISSRREISEALHAER
jgi:DNA-binding CsgD family transcriptional regulator